MLYRFICLLLFFNSILPTIRSQTKTPDDTYFVNLAIDDKNLLIEEWISESKKLTKWSHQARLNFALAAYENAGNDHHLRSKALYCIAKLYFNEGRFGEALAFFDTLSAYAIQNNDIALIISLKNFEGNIYRYQGDYYGALGKIQDAYTLVLNHKIDSLLPMTLNNMGVVYQNLANNSRADEYYGKALQSAIFLKDSHQIIQAYANIGNLLFLEKQPEKAREYYSTGLKLAQKSYDVQQIAYLNNYLGNIYRDNFLFEEALQYYYKAYNLSNDFTLVCLKAEILRNIGVAMQMSGNNTKALEYIYKSLNISQTAGLNRITSDNYLWLAQINSDQGRKDEAYKNLSSYVNLNQQLYNIQFINSVNYYNEKNIAAKMKEQELQSRHERNILLLIIVIVAFAFLVSLLITMLLRNKKQQTIYIEKLKTTLKEKDATEVALRQSENNYQTFIRTLNEGMVVLNSMNNIEFLNFKACKILGSDSMDDLKGFGFERFLFSAEDEKVFRDKMELQKIGIADKYELKIKNLQGEVLKVNFSSAPILDINQNAKGSVNLISNINEDKNSELTYNDLITNLNQKIKQLNCMYDISDISGVPGITFEEIIEKSLEIIPVGLKYSHDIAVQIMFNNKVYSSKNYKETPWSYMVPIKVQKNKLGYLKVLYLEEKPTINRDAFHFNEKILLKNITEKFGQILLAKNMEQVLRESQERLQEVQKLAKIGNWERDFKTGQISYSDIFYDILEITPEKKRFFEHDKFLELIHPDDKSMIENLALDVAGSNLKPVKSINYRVITGKGTIKYIHSTRKIVTDESGEAKRCVYTVQDVTEQKVNQELRYNIEVALKTAEAKQRFLANMSHEMRTPMNGIMGMVEFLLKTRLDSQQNDYAKTIKESSEGLLNILNDILDLSKIEAGKFKIRNQAFDLEPMLDRVRGLFTALARNKRLKLSITRDENIPEKIVTDENRLFQVITNLVSNAVKFSESGKIKLNMVLDSYFKEYMVILVEVSDTGPGIRENEKEQLFIPYSQNTDIQTNKSEGTGLGLAIAKKLVELMGGNIGVHNNKGEGCTFFFTFTAYKPREVSINQTPEKKNIIITDPSLKGLRVLCVDDKKVNQKVMTLMLTQAKCSVTLASNGKEALDLLENNEFDIILLDIVMPVMDGLTTIKEMKKRFPYHPPVIALSANVMEGDKEEYLATGMNDYISKPVKTEDLYQKLILWNNYRISEQLKNVKND